MKVIIAGSRELIEYSLVQKAVDNSGFEIKEIVSGGAKGIDELGELFAKKNRLNLKKFPAKWTKYGNKAGMVRNREMAEYADALIAIWNMKSKGTSNMISEAKSLGLKVYVYEVYPFELI